jgi:hypothetical protein
MDLRQEDERTGKIRVENHGPSKHPVRGGRVALGYQVLRLLEKFPGLIPVEQPLIFGAALFEHLLAVRGIMSFGHVSTIMRLGALASGSGPTWSADFCETRFFSMVV